MNNLLKELSDISNFKKIDPLTRKYYTVLAMVANYKELKPLLTINTIDDCSVTCFSYIQNNTKQLIAMKAKNQQSDMLEDITFERLGEYTVDSIYKCFDFIEDKSTLLYLSADIHTVLCNYLAEKNRD